MSKAQELKPCPFCGAGETLIHVNQGTWTGRGYGEPVSVEVRHWCTEEPGQPSRAIIRVGRDEASAIAAWNNRAPASREQQAAQQDAELMEFIGSVADFKAQRIRLGSTTGEIRWDVEFGHYGQSVRSDTLANAIKKAMKAAARASNGGK